MIFLQNNIFSMNSMLYESYIYIHIYIYIRLYPIYLDNTTNKYLKS